MASFNVLDYVVFLSTIGLSASIGIFFAIWDRNKNTPSDYFLGGRNLHFLPAALSFVVTFQSSLMILGVPADVYMYGMCYSYYCFGAILAYTFAGIVVVPVFHTLQVTSVYKYFELRYGNNQVRYMTVAAGIMFNILYMSMVTYGTCVALEVVIGIPYWATILPYTIVCTIYTSLGGIKAVIWTDVFQLIIMMTGVVAVLVKSIAEAGGINNVSKLAAERLDMNDFRLDPRIRFQFWNVSFGSLSFFMFLTLTQAGIQRINSMPTIRSARLLYIIAGPLYCIFLFITAFEGVTIFAYFEHKGCDIVASGKVTNVNAIIPVTILELFHGIPGLSGLFIASLSSAALSTLSSCLSGLSAITYEDGLKVKYPNISNDRATKLSKIVVILYGFVSMAIALLFSRVEGSVTMLYSVFVGGIDGPTTAVFCLSLLFRRSTTKGMIVGGICGAIISVWLALGQTFADIPTYPPLPPGSTENCYDPQIYNTTTSLYRYPEIYNSYLSLNDTMTTTAKSDMDAMPRDDLSLLEHIYTVSYVLITFIGFMVTLVIGFLVSLCTNMPDKIDSRCLYSYRSIRNTYDLAKQTKEDAIEEKYDLIAGTQVQSK